MRARIDGAKLTEEIMAISDEIDALETDFNREKKACLEEVFVEFNLKDTNHEDDNRKQKIIEKVQQNIENNMNHLIQKQIILNQIYMAKSKARLSELNHVITMQEEAKEHLIDLREAIESELDKIRVSKKQLQQIDLSK